MRVFFTVALLSLAGVVFATSPATWDKVYRLEAQKNYGGAAAIVNTELMSSDDSEFARIHYAWLLYMQGQHQKSIDIYDQAIKDNSLNFDARFGILWPLAALAKWGEVSTQAEKLLEVSPCEYKAFDWLVKSEEAQKNWNKLASSAQNYAKCYPSDANSLVYLARAEVNRGDTQRAIETYRKVLARMPGHLEAKNYLKVKSK